MADYEAVPIVAEVVEGGDRIYLRLKHRLASRNSYLSARLRLRSGIATVRVWTLDDVTVLDVLTDLDAITRSLDGPDLFIRGDLLIRDAREIRVIPTELIEYATLLGRDVRALSTPDLRYAVTFIGEASDPVIRQQRIEVVVHTLPPAENSSP